MLDDDDVQVTIVARKLRAIDLLITGLDTVSSLIDDVVQLLCSHANWQVQRQTFADAIRADIEQLGAQE